MAVNKLNDRQCKTAKAGDKDRKLADGNGLNLLVKVSGAKYWRLSYRYGKAQKTLALGVYPEVSLAEARRGRDEARAVLRDGVDPIIHRKTARLAKVRASKFTFKAAATGWWEHKKGAWSGEHAERVWLRMEQNVLPTLGDLPIEDITARMVLDTCKAVEGRGAMDVARRVLTDINRVCAYAVIEGHLDNVPGTGLSGGLKATKTVHHPALPAKELHAFLPAMDAYNGAQLTRLAMSLLLLTFVRSGELRGARWDEFDIDAKQWRIPGARMKMDIDHIVPLSIQALAVIEEVRAISGDLPILFPSARDHTNIMSENTINKALRVLGWDGKHAGKSKATAHGFRTLASSTLNEHQWHRDAVERQLAHIETNDVRGAYNYLAEHLPERVRMMQWWADFLNSKQAGNNVVPLRVAL